MPATLAIADAPVNPEYRRLLQQAHDVLLLLSTYRADRSLPSGVRSCAETAHTILPSIDAALALPAPASGPDTSPQAS